MKKGSKIIIGGVIAIVLVIGLVIGLVFAGFFGIVFLADQGRKKHNQKVEQAEVDGREFGKTADQNGCMEKGFLRDEKEDSFYSGVAFVEKCLESSKPNPDFCDGVPLSNSVDWNSEQCKKVGHNTQSCFHAFVAKGNFCEGKQIEQARVDGREFGKTTDQNGCLEEGFSRDAALISGFVGGCLKSSKPVPDFCDGVPLGYDPGNGKEVGEWLDEQCKKVDHYGRSCIDAFVMKRDFCTVSNRNQSK